MRPRSKRHRLNVFDVLRGLLMAVATPVATALLATLESGQFPTNWHPFALIAAGAFVSYLVKNFFTGEKKDNGPTIYRGGPGYLNRGFALFTLLILTSAILAQNKKPTAVNDTFPGKPVPVGGIGRAANVLTNDTDPNGDPLTVTKFNGHAFKWKDSIELKDTGIFYMTNLGFLTYKLNPEFTGTVRLTYYVNDGLGSTAKTQTGTIIYRATAAPMPITAIFMYGWHIKPRARPGCGIPLSGKYWVDIVHDSTKLEGYAIKELKIEDGRDAQANILPGAVRYYQYTLVYLAADKKTTSFAGISIQDYDRIVSGGCQ